MSDTTLEPLGADFEAVWDKNVAGLYECDPVPPQPANPAQVTELIEEAKDFTERMTGQPWACELVERLIDAITVAIGAGRSSEPEFETAPDNGTPAEVLAYVLDCTRRWVPEARIIGNARAGDIERAIAAIGAGGQAVAGIVPEGCTGKTLVFDPGSLHVNKDGSGYFVVDEGEWQLEDDRCEGPDGPEGSVHWITRLDASEMQALRDFLNGAPRPHPAPSGQAVGAPRAGKEVVEHMVQRFLSWELPTNFHPDGGISFEPIANAGTKFEYERNPHGTNLLDHRQAAGMVRHMLEGLALPASLGETS